MSSSSKEARIDDGLRGLISTLIPAERGIPEEIIEQHHDDAFRRARPKLATNGGSAPFRESKIDMPSAIDAHLRMHGGDGSAARFGNVYSRLQRLPILNNKDGILKLLYHLLDAEDGGAGGGGPPAPDFRRDAIDRPEPPPGRSPTRLDYSTRAPTTVLERPRTSLAEASSARLNRQALPGMRPKSNVGEFPSSTLAQGSQQTREDSERADGQASQQPAVSPTAVASMDPEEAGPISKSPTESMLLRDLPFVLQGLSTTNLAFSAARESLALPRQLPLPIISLLHTLSEPSLLYRSLTSFVNAEQKGLVMQSLQAAIGLQLRSYLGLISALEGEIRRCLAPESAAEEQGEGAGTEGQRINSSRVGVTLKRCVVWTRDATMGLRLMSVMAEEARSLKGGALISMIHRHSSSYGDPFVSAFAERMLARLTRPFYDMLRQWIYDGELSDPYGEFFVYEPDPEDEGQDDNDASREQQLDPKKVPASSVWEDKYKLKRELIPSIVSEALADKVLLIGKSLNFIRYSCGDSAWVEGYSKRHSRELAYGDTTATLEASIDEAYKATMAHLVDLMGSRFRLFEHLGALKRYLLLGQGDFIALLLESLASNLDKPAGSQYRHTLTAQLDHAVRGSNAQFDAPDVLRRLDARLLELMHGEIGWDVFTLEYRVSAPCDVVVTAWASKQYLAVFNLLWRIKRIEFALGSAWRRIMTGARTVLASVGSSGGGGNGDGGLAADWKQARCTIAEMVHFVNQLQYYVMFEVIESSWNALQASVRREGVTLDDIISAHTRYLRTITHRALLGGAKHSVTGNREDAFPSQLHRLLKTMLAYKDAVDGLYSLSVAEFTRKQGLAARRETRASAGRWGIDAGDDDPLDSPLPGDRPFSAGLGRGEEDDEPPMAGGLAGGSEDHMLPSLRKRLAELSVEFKTRLETLLGDLLVQPDVDLKFLGVAMNFNDVYKPVRRKKRRDRNRDRDRDKERAS